MEGRLMLSGTTVEFMPLDLEAAQISLSALQAGAAENQYAIVATLQEGGFVADRVDLSSIFNAPSITYDGDIVGASSDFSLFGDSSEKLDTLVERATQVMLNRADGTSNWLLFDATGVLNDGTTMQVIAIPSSLDTTMAEADLKPLLDGFVASEPPAEEGGLIPIQPILADPAGRLPGSERIVETPSGVTPRDEGPRVSVAALAAAATSAATNRAISGEWARPMVLETAGGEPTRHEQASAAADPEESPLSTRADNSSGRTPLSVIEAEWASGAQVVTGAKATEGLLVQGQLQPVSESVAFVLDEDGSHRAESSLGGADSVSSTADVGRSPGEVDEPIGTFNVSDLARAAVFEGFSGERLSTVSSVAQGLLRGSAGATPFLLVLALERIATSNSRRANRDKVTQDVGTRSSTRLPSRGGKSLT